MLQRPSPAISKSVLVATSKNALIIGEAVRPGRASDSGIALSFSQSRARPLPGWQLQWSQVVRVPGRVYKGPPRPLISS